MKAVHTTLIPYMALTKHKTICGVKVYESKLQKHMSGMTIFPYFANVAIMIDRNNIPDNMDFREVLFHELIHTTQNVEDNTLFNMELEAYTYQYLYLLEYKDDSDELFNLMWKGLEKFALNSSLYKHNYETYELFKLACEYETTSRFNELWELSRQFRKEIGLD